MTHAPGLPCVSEATEGQEQATLDYVEGLARKYGYSEWRAGHDVARNDPDETICTNSERRSKAWRALHARLRSLVTELETYRKRDAEKIAAAEAVRRECRELGIPCITLPPEKAAVPDVPFPHDADECQCGECVPTYKPQHDLRRRSPTRKTEML